MEAIRQLEAWWAYALRCAQLPPSTPSCRTFWNAVAFAVAAVLVVLVLFLVRRLVRNLLSVREENLRVSEKRRIADPATMSRYKADMSARDIPGGEDVEARIRQALADKRAKEAENMPTPRDSR